MAVGKGSGRGRGACECVDSMVYVWIIILIAVTVIFLLTGFLGKTGDIIPEEAKCEYLSTSIFCATCVNHC